jgi:alpha-1,2-mannosyltransferase
VAVRRFVGGGELVRLGDDRLGFALTGVAGCLLSPITWVHHLVWWVPSLVLLADWMFAAQGRPVFRHRAAFAVGTYLLLCSSLVWLWSLEDSRWDGFVGANATSC